MSSYLKSAAMALLSRTLQALLSKYLSDVDVEGVALPSLSGSAEDGVGVRLCNVKLRDGAKILDLPGTLRAAQTSKKRQRRKQSTRLKHRNSISDENDFLDSDTRNHRPFSATPDCAKQSVTDSNNLYEHSTTVTSPESLVETDSLFTNDIERESPASKPIKKQSWISSLFSRSSIASRDDETDNGSIRQSKSVEDLGEIPLGTTRAKLNLSLDVSINDCENGSPILIQQLTQSTDVADNEVEGNTGNNNRDFNDSGISAEHQPKSAETEESDAANESCEQKMILCLGEGCVIGTLDVRLVGKTIHVLMEDVFLTVEVIRQSSIATDKKSTTSNNVPEKVNNTDGKSINKEPKNAGDRVLAENALARIFSMIPNLFLRDVHVRLIIRDDSVSTRSMADNEDSGNDCGSKDTNIDAMDTVIELVIEMLSVTDGEDFLAKFRSGLNEEDEENLSDEDSYKSEQADSNARRAFRSDSTAGSSIFGEETNDFIVRRIRTGRGTDSGLTLRVFKSLQHQVTPVVNQKFHDRHKDWARSRYIKETKHVLLRCSGLDVQAQIFSGSSSEKTKKSLESLGYDDGTVDSMIFGGIDYIVPGPQPPLPPMTAASPTISSGPNDGFFDFKGSQNLDSAFKMYTTDVNGIQSCPIASSFHRVARGLVPSGHDSNCLPNQQHSVTWSKPGGVDNGHRLDKSIPLAGLVLHLSIRDALELNVDRDSLDTIGSLISLFTKSQLNQAKTDDASEGKNTENDTTGRDDDDDHISEISIASFRALQDSSVASKNTVSDDSPIPPKPRRRRVRTVTKDSNLQSGFPIYMKPEKIQILGFYVAKAVIRVHCLNANRSNEDGFSFCYWSLDTNSVAADFQALKAVEKPFQDLRVDIGYLYLVEHKGLQSKALIEAGSRLNSGTDELNQNGFDNTKSLWPSTAAILLDMLPPYESLIYERRLKHAVQLRFVNVMQTVEHKNVIRRFLVGNVGSVSLDAPFSIRHYVLELIKEAKQSILGEAVSAPVVLEKEIDSMLRYCVRLNEGGHVHLDPLIDAIIPSRVYVVDGELSTASGFSLETIIENVSVKYGSKTPNMVLDKGLSLQQLAHLPDDVRLRILIFLKDLKPLEKALGRKHEKNQFLRYRNVNRGILKLAKQLNRKSIDTRNRDAVNDIKRISNSCRREQLMSELMKLDDNTIESLLKTVSLNAASEQNGL